MKKRQQGATKQADEGFILWKVTLVFDKIVIEGLMGKALQYQLVVFKLFGAPLPKLKRDVKLVNNNK